jgi:hypothetical protein
MAKERHENQFPIPDLVHNHSADDDPETESGKSRAADRAELGAGEVELLSPVVEDAAANGKADARREDGHETRPQKAPGVRRNSWVVGVGEVIDGAHGGWCGSRE